MNRQAATFGIAALALLFCAPAALGLPTALDHDADALTSSEVLVEGGRERRVIIHGECMDSIYLFAHTSSDHQHAGSDDTHYVNIELDSGGIYYAELYDDPNTDQFEKGKSDLWILSIHNDHHGFSVPHGCIKFSDIDQISIEAGGEDGWKIDSVVTVGYSEYGQKRMLSSDLSNPHWIQTDGTASQYEWYLTTGSFCT